MTPDLYVRYEQAKVDLEAAQVAYYSSRGSPECTKTLVAIRKEVQELEDEVFQIDRERACLTSH